MEDISLSEVEYIENYVNNRKPNLLLAYLIWFFFGFFGLHRFYTRRMKSGIIMLFVTLVVSPFTLMIPTIIMWIIDGFTLNSRVLETEEILTDQAIDIVLELRERKLDE